MYNLLKLEVWLRSSTTKKQFKEVKTMTNKQYSQPQLLAVGDAIKTTLYIFKPGRVRDSRWIRRYWLPPLPF